ncbi:MAG TPA: helix-turn-helix domain-containing protein [Acidimicrobiales bacterium]|nr:helix-turn-helix domain-containing protein [Acidimicrobiales bacterium]
MSISVRDRGPSGSPRPYLRAVDRRRQLLEVASAVVDREGLRALTMSHLAHEAGVTRQLVYQHFADLDALLRALLRQRTGGFREAMSRALERGRAGDDLLARVVEVGLAAPANDRRLMRYVFCGLADDQPALGGLVRTLRRQVTDRWLTVLHGTTAVTPAERARVWVVIMTMFTLWSLEDAGEVTAPDALEVMRAAVGALSNP